MVAHGPLGLLGPDGVHFTEAGYTFLAGAVAASVRACLGAAVWDPRQVADAKAGREDLDDTVRPLYQVYLDVDEIIVPSWMVPEPGDELLRWEPDAIAFSSVGRARVERSPGYHVSAEREPDRNLVHRLRPPNAMTSHVRSEL